MGWNMRNFPLPLHRDPFVPISVIQLVMQIFLGDEIRVTKQKRFQRRFLWIQIVARSPTLVHQLQSGRARLRRSIKRIDMKLAIHSMMEDFDRAKPGAKSLADCPH